jgi:hypothetical protein
MTILEWRKTRGVFLSLGLAALLAAGCGDSDDSPTTPSPGGEAGTLTIEMTDAPIDDVAELWVYVSGLDLKPAGGPLVRLRPPEMRAGLYDLLGLRDGVSVILFDAAVESTDYQFIEIELDQDRSFLIERDHPGIEVPLQIASGKAKLNGGPFRVRPDGSTTVLFDFDAAKSLKRKGNGDYLQIVRTTESG